MINEPITEKSIFDQKVKIAFLIAQCSAIIKDREMKDEEKSTKDDPITINAFGETHDLGKFFPPGQEKRKRMTENAQLAMVALCSDYERSCIAKYAWDIAKAMEHQMEDAEKDGYFNEK